MILNMRVIADDSIIENDLVNGLRKVLGNVADVVVHPGFKKDEQAQILFFDGRMKDLESLVTETDRRGKAVFLIVDEGQTVPKLFSEGTVDDVLVRPFRYLEVVSKLSRYRQIMMWDEVSKLNSSFQELLSGLHEDLKLAERLQKAKLPVRFPDIKGFKITSRYLAGLKAGGDYFDVAESRDGSFISLMLSDSSSYGLSSAVLSVLMKVATKLNVDESRSTREMVRRIQDELLMALSERDHLSLFYGIISRKDLSLRYVNLGSATAYLARKGGVFVELPSQAGPLTREKRISPEGEEARIILEPEDRIVLVSDGFVESVGGTENIRGLLDHFRDKEAVDAINEFVYSVKTKWTDPDEMPAQDCTAMIVDVDSRIIRLTPR